MKNRPLVLILILYVTLSLLACTSFPLRKHPSPTSTNTPTLAPTNTPTVHTQAQEIALSLSGDKAIECGAMVTRLLFEPELIVDQCILDALQNKQPFRAFRSQIREEFSDYYWIIGTPTGDIYLIYYAYGDMGTAWPTKQLCENPHISNFVDYDKNITDKKFLECK